MGTRSNIGIEWENGDIFFVYCHWDGYPLHNGRILLEHYTTKEDIAELISLGDLSILGVNLDKTKDYHTWRGEELRLRKTASREEVCQEEYAYIYCVAEGRWYSKGHGYDWTPLDTVMEECG
jgi:hypothetical protein